MRIAMPSPRGTNYAKLFMPYRGMAMDSAAGLTDTDTDAGTAAENDNPAAELKLFLESKLSADDYARATALIDALGEGDEPQPGVAQDAKLRESFLRRFPDAARLRRSF
jgi:hypothetical protein